MLVFDRVKGVANENHTSSLTARLRSLSEVNGGVVVPNVPVKMATDEFLNARLTLCVQVLKLVHCGELFEVEAIGSDDV